MKMKVVAAGIVSFCLMSTIVYGASMEQALLTILRNKNTSMKKFRKASDKLASVLAIKVAEHLRSKKVTIETPLKKTNGVVLNKNIILIPIVRSGIALLKPFQDFFEDARVGYIVARRDEKTAEASLYYDNIPEIGENDDVVILEPMIATGGSATAALKVLIDKGIRKDQIIFASVVAVPEGLRRIHKEFPGVRVEVIQVDPILNKIKFIVPGLGDYGDRYYGTD